MTEAIHAGDVQIEIDVDEDYELITLKIVTESRSLTVGFSIGEAQLFHSMLGEAVTNMILDRIGLQPLPPETRH